MKMKAEITGSLGERKSMRISKFVKRKINGEIVLPKDLGFFEWN